jgi:hypothetical protein
MPHRPRRSDPGPRLGSPRYSSSSMTVPPSTMVMGRPLGLMRV